MQEADADDALTGAHVLAGAGAGLGVDLDVLVQIHQILDALVVAVLLDHGVDDQLGGAGGVVVGQPDQILVLVLQQVSPVLRSLDAHAGQLVGVDHEAQDALVDAVPVAILVAVHVAHQVGGVGGIISLQQTLGSADIVRIGGAAEPHVGGRIAVLLLHLALHLTGGQALERGLDAEQILEVLARGGQILLLAGAVDDQFALGLCRGDQILHAVEILGIGSGVTIAAALLIVGGRLVAAGDQAQSHDQRQQKCKKLLHSIFLRSRFSKVAFE